jgi:hypothetical protein
VEITSRARFRFRLKGSAVYDVILITLVLLFFLIVYFFNLINIKLLIYYSI